MTKELIKGCEFNPKNLPIEKIGICKNEYHESLMGERPHRNTKVRLIMLYSQEYIENWCDCSKKHKLTDEEYDKKSDEMEKIRYQPKSEKYYCDPCCDDLMEYSC